MEALGELSDLVRDALRYYPGLRNAPQRWVLVDAAPKILSEIPTPLGDYAARELARRGVDIRVSTTLESVDAEAAVLSDGSRFETRTLVWTAGVKANPLIGRLGLPLDERGRVVVDPTLRVEGRDERLGARRLRTRPERGDSRRPDPPTCQHALRQARRLAKNLKGERKPYRYRMLGQVATLGRYKGIADVLGLRLRGFPGWFVTRTYHLFQLPLVSAEAARGRRLDGGALLPPGHRRALDARHARGARRDARRGRDGACRAARQSTVNQAALAADNSVHALAASGANDLGAVRLCSGRRPPGRHAHRRRTTPCPSGNGVHFYGVGFTAVAATAAAVVLTSSVPAATTRRTVLVGTAFSVMAALLALHGLATPGMIVARGTA